MTAMDDRFCRELVEGLKVLCEDSPEEWERFRRGERNIGFVIDQGDTAAVISVAANIAKVHRTQEETS